MHSDLFVMAVGGVANVLHLPSGEPGFEPRQKYRAASRSCTVVREAGRTQGGAAENFPVVVGSDVHGGGCVDIEEEARALSEGGFHLKRGPHCLNQAAGDGEA